MPAKAGISARGNCMLRYWRPILYPIILFILFLIPQTYASLSDSNFTSAEHAVMGNEIRIQLSTENPAEAGYIFQLPNGLNVTYGDIISIVDLYGNPEKPISQGDGNYARKARFMAAFKDFAMHKETAKETQVIIDTIHEEHAHISSGLAAGKSIEEIYKNIAIGLDRKLNCITGGSCSKSSWWVNPGRYLKLSYSNYDHFSQNAYRSYQIGHSIALEKALAAHTTGNIELLKLAYTINAFASHFLADRFSSGHIRVPRMSLPHAVSPNIVGNILANYMHNEENKHGLHVYNKLGNHWIAYGDRAFLNTTYSEHRQILQQVLQNSADQIFAAFRDGVIPKDNIRDYIPYPDEKAAQASNDITPMFQWDKKSKKLYRRTDLSNPEDTHTTLNWWGWSTVYELRDKHGIKVSDQAILALSNYSNEALHHGLITDKEMIAYIYHSAI